MNCFLAVMLIAMAIGIVTTIIPFLCSLIYETILVICEHFQYK